MNRISELICASTDSSDKGSPPRECDSFLLSIIFMRIGVAQVQLRGAAIIGHTQCVKPLTEPVQSQSYERKNLANGMASSSVSIATVVSLRRIKITVPLFSILTKPVRKNQRACSA